MRILNYKHRLKGDKRSTGKGGVFILINGALRGIVQFRRVVIDGSGVQNNVRRRRDQTSLAQR